MALKLLPLLPGTQQKIKNKKPLGCARFTKTIPIELIARIASEKDLVGVPEDTCTRHALICCAFSKVIHLAPHLRLSILKFFDGRQSILDPIESLKKRGDTVRTSSKKPLRGSSCHKKKIACQKKLFA